MLVFCEKRSIKTMLGLVNYMAAACGLILLAISAYGLFVTVKFKTGPELKLTTGFIMSLGVAILVVVICEHFGRTFESFYMTTVYSHLMMTIMAFVLVVGVVLRAGKIQFSETFQDWMKASVTNDCKRTVELLGTYGHCCALDEESVTNKTCECAYKLNCFSMMWQVFTYLSLLFLVVAVVLLVAAVYAYLFSTKLRYIPQPNDVAADKLVKPITEVVVAEETALEEK